MKDQLTIAVCDDEMVSLATIKGAIQSYFELEQINVNIETFQSVITLYGALQKTKFDLLFLDIDINGDDGIFFAKKLREEHSKIPLVFISSHEERVYESIAVTPLAFIRKDKFIRDITEFMERFINTFDSMFEKDESIMVQIQNQGLYKVPLNNILYFEGWKHYQLLYEVDQKDPKVIISKMKDLEQVLTTSGFVRIQRGYIVNLKHVIGLERNELVLINKHRLLVSRNLVQNVKKVIIEYHMSHDVMIL